MWRLNKMLLNNQWIYSELKGENKKYLETNENGNITVQNMYDTTKAVLKSFNSNTGICKKQEKSETNNLTLHIKELKKENQRPKLLEGRK